MARSRTPSPPARAGRLSAVLVAVLAALLGVAGCADIRAQVDGTRADPDVVEAPVAQPILETVQVGVLDGMVSILVRNPTSQLLRHADAVIAVTDGDGRTVAQTALSAADRACCTAVNLPPGEEFGFFVQMTEDPTLPAPLAAADILVSIDYQNVSWSASAAPGGPTATAVADPAVPLAPLDALDPTLGVGLAFIATTSGGPIPAAVVQAVLTGPDGTLAAVVTGTYTCLAPGQGPSVPMQLYHPVPEGTTITSFSVFPVDPAEAAELTDSAQAACPVA